MVIYEFNIPNLYQIAVLEGEGWGTAYEYYAKLPLLNKLFKKANAKKVIILGLPEKYGFSMDLILCCYFNKIKQISIFDERKDKIDRFSKVLENVCILTDIQINLEISKVNWDEIEANPVDIILSCEVLQRLDNSSKDSYIKFILNNAKKYLIFVPNGKNEAHENISKLKTIHLDKLIEMFNKTNITNFGYIDCPPNPPGFSIKSKNSKDITMKDAIKNFIISWLLLIWYYLFERRLSFSFKKFFDKRAHIVFIDGEIVNIV